MDLTNKDSKQETLQSATEGIQPHKFHIKRYILIVFIVLFVIILIVLSKRFYTKKFLSSGNGFHSPFGNISTTTSTMKLVPGEHIDNQGCSGSGKVMFGTSPMDPKNIQVVLPIGEMVGAHVTPIDHMYFWPKGGINSKRDDYEVYAISDGVITSISARTQVVGDKDNGAKRPAEYQIKFWHTCDFASYYDLLTSLSPRIQAQFDAHKGSNNYASLEVPVKEGEVVGRIGSQTLDFTVYDYTKILPGFIVPSHYMAESWKLHVVNAFDFFKEPVKSQLLMLNPRKVEPRSGKIDYDIDGKLVGNWFKLGNNGFAKEDGSDPTPWRGHLSFVYDAIDPSQIRVSIGDYNGLSEQFGVLGNSPDPAKVDSSSGVTKYSLTQFAYFMSNGSIWNGMESAFGVTSKNQSNVTGVALVQLIGSRQLKFEAFPNKSVNQVLNFDSKATIYER